MRISALLLALGLALAATAAPQPLSNKEIGLMLRSGYSSESILSEVTNRHLLEPLDDATKKSLLNFGASGQLLAALGSNAYLVTTSEADRARARDAEIAAQRAAQIERDRQLGALRQAQQAEAQSRSGPAVPSTETPILDALKSKLVRCHNGTVRRAESSELENKKLVALYYSAHWCGPCRRFTPQLVEYYNRVAAAHPEFELIFVSADRSRFGWETYIREMKMPWLAIDYDQLGGLGAIKILGGSSIPSLLLLDGSSRIIATSYDGEKYLGPQNAIAALDQIFAGKTGGRVAQGP